MFGWLWYLFRLNTLLYVLFLASVGVVSAAVLLRRTVTEIIRPIARRVLVPGYALYCDVVRYAKSGFGGRRRTNKPVAAAAAAAAAGGASVPVARPDESDAAIAPAPKRRRGAFQRLIGVVNSVLGLKLPKLVEADRSAGAGGSGESAALKPNGLRVCRQIAVAADAEVDSKLDAAPPAAVAVAAMRFGVEIGWNPPALSPQPLAAPLSYELEVEITSQPNTAPVLYSHVRYNPQVAGGALLQFVELNKAAHYRIRVRAIATVTVVTAAAAAAAAAPRGSPHSASNSTPAPASALALAANAAHTQFDDPLPPHDAAAGGAGAAAAEPLPPPSIVTEQIIHGPYSDRIDINFSLPRVLFVVNGNPRQSAAAAAATIAASPPTLPLPPSLATSAGASASIAAAADLVRRPNVSAPNSRAHILHAWSTLPTIINGSDDIRGLNWSTLHHSLRSRNSTHRRMAAAVLCTVLRVRCLMRDCVVRAPAIIALIARPELLPAAPTPPPAAAAASPVSPGSMAATAALVPLPLNFLNKPAAPLASLATPTAVAAAPVAAAAAAAAAAITAFDAPTNTFADWFLPLPAPAAVLPAAAATPPAVAVAAAAAPAVAAAFVAEWNTAAPANGSGGATADWLSFVESCLQAGLLLLAEAGAAIPFVRAGGWHLLLHYASAHVAIATALANVFVKHASELDSVARESVLFELCRLSSDGGGSGGGGGDADTIKRTLQRLIGDQINNPYVLYQNAQPPNRAPPTGAVAGRFGTPAPNRERTAIDGTDHKY